MQSLCGAAALARWGFAPSRGQPFAALGASRAVLEVDGFGYQASLMSKLTLGSASIVSNQVTGKPEPKPTSAPAPTLTRTLTRCSSLRPRYSRCGTTRCSSLTLTLTLIP